MMDRLLSLKAHLYKVGLFYFLGLGLVFIFLFFRMESFAKIMNMLIPYIT